VTPPYRLRKKCLIEKVKSCNRGKGDETAVGVKKSSWAILLLLSLSAALTAASSTAWAQQDQTLQEKVVAEVTEFSKMISAHLSMQPDIGAAIAIVDDKQVVWEHTYGCLDGAGSRPINANTMFSIQSMSKSFTALAVLMAVQGGLVDLDTPIKEYLPDFRVNSVYDEHPEESITLRLLLTHRAGFTFGAPFGSQYDDRYDFTKHIESISETWLRYPVGYRLCYSNAGIDLAGYILQSLSGMPFEQYVKEEVLDPIGMDSSSLDMAVIESRENRAIGHSAHGELIPLRIPMIPAGGVYTTLHDMAKYLRFHINKGVVDGRRVLRADLMEEMHTIQFARPGQRAGYCLALNREPVSNSYSIYHSGAGYGFSSDMMMYPELDLGLIVLCNSMDTQLSGNQALRGYIDSYIVRENGETPVESPGTETMTKLSVEDPRIQAVLGHYGDPRVGTVTVERSEDDFTIRLSADQDQELEFYDDNGELVGMFGQFTEVRFLPPYSDKRGSLFKIDRRLGGGVFWNVWDFNYGFDEPPGPNKPEWSRYLGEYQVFKYGVPYQYTGTVSIRNGYLFYNECKCAEYEPGLFFIYDGDALDLRSQPPTFANIILHKK
jgi:CubicO group peptidase (beta-lactamase class C family)